MHPLYVHFLIAFFLNYATFYFNWIFFSNKKILQYLINLRNFSPALFLVHNINQPMQSSLFSQIDSLIAKHFFTIDPN